MKQFTRIFSLIFVLAFVFLPAFAFAGDTTHVATSGLAVPSSDIMSLLSAIAAPILTYLVTKLVTLVKADIPDKIITAVIVPVTALALSGMATLVGTSHSWIIIFLLSLAATFIHEFVSNFQSPNPPAAGAGS